MKPPRSGDDRARWASAVARYVRALIKSGYSGEELSSRIRAAKHKETEWIETMAECAESEARAND